MQRLKYLSFSTNLILLGGVVGVGCHVSLHLDQCSQITQGLITYTDNIGSNLNCRNSPEGCFWPDFSRDAKLIYNELEDARYRCTQYETSVAAAPLQICTRTSKQK